MIATIHQPNYWPWLGLLDKIAKSDVFVILDNVQLNKDSNQRRNIFLANGRKKYLTIPVDYKLGVKINEAEIKDTPFAEKHYDTLRNWYLKSAFFDEIDSLIKPIYSKKYDKLIDILKATMFASLEIFGLSPKVVFASELNVSGAKAELVLNICRALKTDTYLSGRGAIGYFQDRDYRAFSEAGIKLIFQNFVHPVYEQFNSEEFVSGLGCLDALFSCGIEAGRRIVNRNIEQLI